MSLTVKKCRKTGWILIENYYALEEWFEKNNWKREPNEIIEAATRGELNDSRIPEDMKSVSEYISGYLSVIMRISLNARTSRSHIEAFLKSGFLWVNNVGGWNTIEDLCKKEDLVEINIDGTRAVPAPKIGSEILYLENDEVIEPEFMKQMEVVLAARGYQKDLIENYSAITRLQVIAEHGDLAADLKAIISEVKKPLTICFATTQRKLILDQIALFGAFSKYIKIIYFSGGEEIESQLNKIGAKCERIIY